MLDRSSTRTYQNMYIFNFIQNIFSQFPCFLFGLNIYNIAVHLEIYRHIRSVSVQCAQYDKGILILRSSSFTRKVISIICAASYVKRGVQIHVASDQQ